MSTSNTVEESLDNVVEQVHSQNAMLQALDDLFLGVKGESVVLPSGTRVIIHTAKVKHLREITDFVTDFLQKFTQEEIVQLIAMTTRAQEDLIKEGENPYVNFMGQIKTYIGGAAILAKVIKTVTDVAPRFLSLFTDMTIEDFDELELDEASMVSYAIFGRNYHFFSQKVRPAIRGCIALLQSQKKQENNEPDAST